MRSGSQDRLRRGAESVLAGWLAAWVASLAFEVPEIVRNSGPGLLAYDLALGLGAWSGFTLLVCVGTGAAVVLPASLLFSPEEVWRVRWRTAAASCAVGVYVVGRRLGVWAGFREGGPHNPLDSQLFWMYALFAAVFATGTVLVYAGRRPA